MKNNLLKKMFFVAIMLTGSVIFAQTVSGIISDESGPLPGASVLVKGTSNGVTTDFDGNFTLDNVASDATLVVDFLGFKSQDVSVAGKSVINVTLEVDASQLDEVVVTALGIKRSAKTLTYAQQTISSDELTRTRDINFLNSLSGKAAGVEIKKSASGAGGSTKIVLRGSKSLSGDSQPLFVIDGIPMANNKGGQPGMWGGVDGGDGLSAINPDDIENISILKGSNAAVLYGSAGANGVVVITTKSGKSGKTNVTFNTGINFDQVTEIPDLQFKYGAIGSAKESWDTTAGNYDSNYVDDFFQTGYTSINSISASGGNDKTTAYFSYANTSGEGITPENKYKKNNISFKSSTKIGEKVTVNSSVIFSVEDSENRLPAGYYLNPLTGLYMFPRNRDFNDYKNNYQVLDVGRNMNLQNWFVEDHHQSNPYWIINKQPRTSETKRAIGSLNISYEITEDLKLQVRGSYDYASKENEQQHAAGSNGANAHTNGAWNYRKYEDELVYTDAIFTYNKDLGENFTLNAVLGGSYQKSNYGNGVSVGTGTVGLLYPNEFYFQNVPGNVPVNSTWGGEVIKQGAFANFEFGYKEMLFLNLAGRNDWASTLAGTGNDSYFYPSIGVTGIVSQMLELPDFISFAKVRASYTNVANEVPFNVIAPSNSINSTGGVSRNTRLPFYNGKPEIISSTEIGADVRFFSNRFGIDFTYYNLKSTDQFLTVPLDISDPIAEGKYTSRLINAGEIVNKGIEIMLTATPIRTDNLEWRTNINYSANDNEIVDIGPDDTKTFNQGSSEGYQSKLVEGGSFNDLYVLTFLRDDQDRILFDGGKPLRSKTRELVGNLDPDWSLGWNNTVSYKNWSFGILISGKFGGEVFSQTESMLDGAGVSQRTAVARDNGGVAVNGVDQSSGTPISTVDSETWFRAIGDRNGIGEAYVFDRTNVRLSQLTVAYNFNVENSKFLNAATISFIGGNLIMFHNDAPFDPELAMSTNQNAQGLDNFNLPATKTYGLNLKVNF